MKNGINCLINQILPPSNVISKKTNDSAIKTVAIKQHIIYFYI